ncbi:isoflavone reductase family protein [Rutstroemia sp. NJR-2017a BBW]|nr:isoflavone reductase family protein [Rutstroemia sp. NJR-2017a BBW]
MSATVFRNIALLGATGNLGSKILVALKNAGFTVTAIQRKESTNVPADGVKSIKVDLTSGSDLTAAFKGQDVVVSATPNPRLDTEKIWMEAALNAGVKRIVPSEYSTNLETEAAKTLPIVTDKLAIRKYVQDLTSSGKIDWTSVNNGPFFLSWLWLSGWMGPNPKTKTATIHDDGEAIVCTSSLERIAEGVAKALSSEHADETKNKPIYVYTTAMSERKMIDIVAKISGDKFQETKLSIATITKEAFEALKRGDESKKMNFYVPFCFGSEYRGDFRYQAWNEKLGLKELTDAELEETIKRWLEEMK